MRPDWPKEFKRIAWPKGPTITLDIDGDMFSALIGANLQEGVGGFGRTIPNALRDLANRLEKELN